MAKGDGDKAWRTLGSFPEFKAAFGPSPLGNTPPAFGHSAAAPASTDFLERDYELDIGGCITRSFELMKTNFGTLFGGFLLVIALIALASVIINGLATLVLPAHSAVFREVGRLVAAGLLAPLTGPLMAGFYWLYIRLNRGETANTGDVFAGFKQNFKDLFLGNLIISLVSGLCVAPYMIVNDTKMMPILEKIQQVQHTNPDELQSLLPQLWSGMFASLPLFLVCMIPAMYLAINWQFALPLILDKQMAFWPAMMASWKQVHKHWWQVFGLVIVVGLVGAAGLLGCCIGVIFTFPIGMGAVMIAYETIFGARKN